MANPATIADVEARWRPLSAQETINATAFLDDAWWLLTARLPSLEQNMTDGTVIEGNVVRVVAAMVIRVLRNPDGKVQEAIDDYSYRRAELVSAGALTITDDELSTLTPGGSAHVSSVRLVVYGER